MKREQFENNGDVAAQAGHDHSAALRFIPLEQMKDQGYEKFVSAVEKK